MDQNWKNDPRLKAMSREKLELLTSFAKQIESAGKDRLMEALLSVSAQAREQGVHFTDRETALLVTIMSAGMAPAERKKIDLLKMLSKKLARPR